MHARSCAQLLDLRDRARSLYFVIETEPPPPGTAGHGTSGSLDVQVPDEVYVPLIDELLLAPSPEVCPIMAAIWR